MSTKEIIPFIFEGNREIRVITINGEPWFVVKDLCDNLDIGNPSQAVENFPENEILKLCSTEVSGARETGSWGGASSFLCVNEPGMYRLIFQSRKPEADSIKTWVFTEVLPSIRKTGKYTVTSLDKPTLAELRKRYILDHYTLEEPYDVRGNGRQKRRFGDPVYPDKEILKVLREAKEIELLKKEGYL
jgi:prophage antirepressor-like protein